MKLGHPWDIDFARAQKELRIGFENPWQIRSRELSSRIQGRASGSLALPAFTVRRRSTLAIGGRPALRRTAGSAASGNNHRRDIETRSAHQHNAS